MGARENARTAGLPGVIVRLYKGSWFAVKGWRGLSFDCVEFDDGSVLNGAKVRNRGNI